MSALGATVVDRMRKNLLRRLKLLTDHEVRNLLGWTEAEFAERIDHIRRAGVGMDDGYKLSDGTKVYLYKEEDVLEYLFGE